MMVDEGNGGFNASRWTNWVGNQTCEPKAIIKASSEQTIATAVRDARQRGLGVRTPGSGHSFTPNALTDGVLLNTRDLSGIVDIDTIKNRVTVKAHTTIATMVEALWDAGLSLKNQGDIDSQAIAGAVATSTHGSGAALQSFSGSLRGCKLVDGTGDVRHVSQDVDTDIFGAFQTSIGMLGIMTELTMEVMPAYYLHEQIVFMPVDEVMEKWDHLRDTYRHFSFFWMPADHSSALYGFPEAKADTCMVKLYQEAAAPTTSTPLPDGERIDRAYKIYPHVFEPNFHELEYFMPADESLDIFRDHRQLMLASLPDSVFPMEVRFVAADEAWMSPCYQRDSLVISVSGQPGTDYWPYLKKCDHHLYHRGGRPHWGKLHFSTADRLKESFPTFEAFKAVRRRYDPDGLFLNDHLRPLFGD